MNQPEREEVEGAHRASTGGNVPAFPVVGVGASAGGLQAFRTLLREIGNAPGVALVYVQHLAPDHDSMIASIVAKDTAMPVVEAGNAMRIERDHVYVIPPGKYLTVADHGLFLEPPIARDGLRMPIDHFLSSLAHQLGDRSVAVILSGTGTDGSLGVREVKAAGGLVVAQRPEEAEYDGMPRSAIRTGHVDVALPLAEIPKRIRDYIAHPYVRGRSDEVAHDKDDAFKAITVLLSAQTDYDFGAYRRGTMVRRVMRRMSLRQITDPGRYLQVLRSEPAELQAMFADLLIGVTRFFREPPAWAVIEEQVIPQLSEQARAEDRPLRAWVPGCSTGEEAYTLAILLQEERERSHGALDFQVFATDLNDRAIARARLGCYAPNIADDVDAARLEKHFHEEEGQFRLNKNIRERLVFAPHNLLRDPPFLRTDFISCRNLLIYLEAPVQQRVIDVFAFSLREGGVMLLGTSEGAGANHRSFDAISSKWRIHRRIPNADAPIPISPRRAPTPEWVSRSPETGEKSADRLVGAAQAALLARYAPATIVMSADGTARYFAGPVGRFLAIPPGHPTADVMAMAPAELRSRLRSAIHQVRARRERVQVTAPNVVLPEGKRSITIDAEPLGEGDPALVLICLQTLTEPDQSARPALPDKDGDPREAVITQLEDELRAVREDLQSTIEELETTNEELKASNEEATSVNEEMQSANEELETSREELQSMNEELTTVNAQLEDKVDEMEGLYDDLSNLLRSTDLAVLFLDDELAIRRFTPAATDLLDVIESDIGRPAAHLALASRDATLLDDARKVRADLTPDQTELRFDHRWFSRTIRPFRTSENRISGIVVVYFDVTEQRRAIDALARREAQSAAAIDLGQTMIKDDDMGAVMDETCAVLKQTLDADYVKILRVEEGQNGFRLVAGAGWPEGLSGAYVPGGRDSQAGYTRRVSSPVVVEDLREEQRFRGPAILTDNGVRSGISCLIGPRGQPFGVLGVHSRKPRHFDANDTQFLETVASLLYGAQLRSDAMQELAKRERLLRLAMESARMGAFVLNPRTDEAEVDPVVYRLFDLDPNEPVTGRAVLDRILPEDRPVAQDALQRSVNQSAPYEAEFRIRRRDGTVRWIAGFGSAAGQNGDKLLFGVNTDVTERKENEERERYTTRELDHRVKNVLATVSSITGLAGQSASSLDEFKASLSSRIRSLARTHTRLSDARWSGIDLETLIADELAPYKVDEVTIDLEGPRVMLPPEATQTLGLAVHELATNAAKYGAIHHGGHIAVSWRIVRSQGTRHLEFDWIESGTGPVGEPSRVGFGTMVIRDLMRQQLGAEVTQERGDDGLRLRYSFPFEPALTPSSEPDPATGENANTTLRSGTTDDAPFDLTGKRVLIVEDEYFLAAEMKKRLERRGASVVGPAMRLKEATKRADEDRFDLVLLDMNLAGESTADLARSLKDRNCPVILCSGYSRSSLTFEGLEEAPRLGKPVMDDDLDVALSQALSG